MKTSELLERAEAHLWDGVGDMKYREACGLCGAIHRASVVARRSSPSTKWGISDAAGRALSVIDDALKGYMGWYTSWALVKGHLPRDWSIDERKWQPIIQANRLNWLRELQRQFKEKGD